MARSLRNTLLGFTSWMALTGSAAYAQTATAPSAKPKQSGGLTEIVVTAQKRAQRVQDVPIAITAITSATLKANRITTVNDLSGIAPNVTVRESAGSVGLPAFTIRGVTSYGVVPGQDKEASIYLDGVYIGAPEGEIFQLPDVARIEVLRGPQGTLFGRNATSGAVSIVTRDPTGVLGGEQDFSGGNYGQFRSRTSVNLPAYGPFSAYFTYVHDQREGDIKNLGAGQVWGRFGPNTNESGEMVSPKTLGAHDSNSYFLALKYEPNDSFRTTYKFDYFEDNYTPDGDAAVAVNPIGLGFVGDFFLQGVLEGNTGKYVLDPSARRPDAANNAFATPAYERAYGHNLTSTYQLTDDISLKNIAAYRDTFVYANAQLDGLGGLTLPTTLFGITLPASLGAGPHTPFEVLTDQSQSETRTVSDELQAIYTSKYLTLTTGALFYHQNGFSGAPPGEANNYALTAFPNGHIPYGNESTSDNRATSLAAYFQAEIHITPKLDLVGGYRITHDNKSGDYFSSGPAVNGVLTGVTNQYFNYKKTKPAYSVGLDYKIAHDILVYGKYSYSFVSGGEIGNLPFQPETASSVEIGGKADFLDHRLRANLALFDVDYENLQAAESGVEFGFPALGTLVVDQGGERSKGAELELTARPIDPVTLGASAGYTDARVFNVNPILETIYDNTFAPTLLPKWTADVNGQYETNPLFAQAKMIFRMDGIWHSRERSFPSSQNTTPGYAALEFIPASWVVNARVSLVDIPLGAHTMEVALWSRNLFNNKLPSFPDAFESFALSTTFQAARTYGVDVNFTF